MFEPGIYVYAYLDSTNQLTSYIRVSLSLDFIATYKLTHFIVITV